MTAARCLFCCKVAFFIVWSSISSRGLGPYLLKDVTVCVISTEELAWLGSIPRCLKFDTDDQDEGVTLPTSIPTDFRGDVTMVAPKLCVEGIIKHSDDGDDGDRKADSDDESNEEGIEISYLRFSTLAVNQKKM